MSQSNAASTGQVPASAAEVYRDFFVPALFDQWPEHVLAAAGLVAGDDVLDVGCGTGVLAEAAARRLGDAGSITAVDVNEAMLVVARRSNERVDWKKAAAEQLPFADGSFDRVISQFALMFFEDRPTALTEMRRVTRDGGSVTLATWAEMAESPGYATLSRLLQRLFGDAAAAALAAPFCLGSSDELHDLVAAVLPDVAVSRREGTARFDSLEAWMHTEIRGWTLADAIDDDQYIELLGAAEVELAAFVRPDGTVRFPAPALLATARVS